MQFAGVLGALTTTEMPPVHIQIAPDKKSDSCPQGLPRTCGDAAEMRRRDVRAQQTLKNKGRSNIRGDAEIYFNLFFGE